MSLRPAVWTDDLPPPPPRHNPMAIASLVHHRESDEPSVAPSECSSQDSGEIPQRPARIIHRSATIHFRYCREQGIDPPVAKVMEDRYYCAYRSPRDNNALCHRWPAGYATLNELGRHVDSDHAAEESELIEQGRLTYSTAQWIKTREQHAIVRENVQATMSCDACGTKFASCRPDSIGRHLRNGACERAQERQTKMSLAPTEHKKKHGNSYMGQIRR